MSRVWFRADLETVGTFWRIARRDGVTLGFTSHDRDLWFDGVLHSASPGMVPSSIRRSADFEPDSAEVRGALSHGSITALDLSLGRFDNARVAIGLVDWETLEREILYRGTIGALSEEDGRFNAELVSRKAELLVDPMPRTSPTCRAVFCGAGCTLSAVHYQHEARFTALDAARNAVTLVVPVPASRLVGGELRWLDGPHAGLAMTIVEQAPTGLVLDYPVDADLPAGSRAIVREGCDRTIDTCATRFANAVNFQGEPFLPGNDLLTRYPTPGQ